MNTRRRNSESNPHYFKIFDMQVLSQLVSAATSLQTSPPPAIAAALALQSRDDLQRCGRVTGQLRAAVIHLQVKMN